MMMTTKKMKKQPTDRPLTCSSLAFIQQSQLSLKKKKSSLKHAIFLFLSPLSLFYIGINDHDDCKSIPWDLNKVVCIIFQNE